MVLVLAGTSEAAELVRRLAERDRVDVVTSFAGRTTEPADLPGEVRTGGFGGIEGLAAVLQARPYDLLVDATHPFAARMPHQAAAAAARAGVPRVRLLRPGWRAAPGDRWHRVRDLPAAAHELERLGARRALLTTGRLDLAPFAGLAGVHLVTRSIEPPDPMPLTDATVVLARGPFDLGDELALLGAHRIDALVTKDSGGTATAPKLEAARLLDLDVVMVDRPPPPPGPIVGTAAEALAWIDAQLPRP